MVEVDEVSGILTAEHVVSSKEFRQAKGLWTIPHIYSAECVKEKTAHFSATNIRMDLLRCFPETPRSENEEWGPDLAFIRIPRNTNFESSLRAVRINFYAFAHDPTNYISLPAGWLVTTALRGSGIGPYSAPTYHELADAQTFVGKYSLDSLLVDGKALRIAVWPADAYTAAVQRNMRTAVESPATRGSRLLSGRGRRPRARRACRA